MQDAHEVEITSDDAYRDSCATACDKKRERALGSLQEILVASHVLVTEFLKTYVILVAVAVQSSWICPASTFGSILSTHHQLSPTYRRCISWL
jgi:hypothetical protein